MIETIKEVNWEEVYSDNQKLKRKNIIVQWVIPIVGIIVAVIIAIIGWTR